MPSKDSDESFSSSRFVDLSEIHDFLMKIFSTAFGSPRRVGSPVGWCGQVSDLGVAASLARDRPRSASRNLVRPWAICSTAGTVRLRCTPVQWHSPIPVAKQGWTILRIPGISRPPRTTQALRNCLAVTGSRIGPGHATI